MKLILEKIIIENFKGTKFREVEFNHDLTYIVGNNGQGKTTIFDGLCWLLFGKDSQMKTDFEIKPLDENNNYIHKLVTAIEGHFVCDGLNKVFRREYKENWSNRQATGEEVMTGHETSFYIDTVPLKKKDYEEVIDKIIPENVFKLITNPFYFANMKREEMRKIVLEVAGEPSMDEIASGIKKFEAMINAMEGKDIDTFKKMIASKIKDIKDKKKEIEPAIKENQKILLELPDVSELKKFESDKEAVESEIAIIGEKINNKQKAMNAKLQEFKELQEKRAALTKEVESEKNSFRAESNKKVIEFETQIETLESEKRANERQLKSLKEEIASLDSKIAQKEAYVETLRDMWRGINASEFITDENSLKCKYCGADLKDGETLIETQKENFAKQKAKDLQKVVSDAAIANEELTRLRNNKNEAELSISNLPDAPKLEERINALKFGLDTLKASKTSLEYSKEIIAKEAEIERIGKEVEKFSILEDADAEFKERMEYLNKQRDLCLDLIKKVRDVKTRNLRIKELSDLDTSYASEIAKLQKQEMIVDEFNKRKIEMMEDKITSKFNGVKFKMFNHLINGNDEPTCEVLIGGVPFSSANNGGKINTGIKIINAFCKHYGVNAPLFIDNAEGITQIEKTESQMIELIVPAPTYQDAIVL